MAPRPPVPQRKSMVVFFRSLALLVNSGIAFHRGLDLLARQSEDPQMRLVCVELARDLLSGRSLSQSMALQPKAFSSFQTHLIRVGEKTGRLDLLLVRLAEYEEQSYQLGLKVRSAITYPAFIFGVTLILLLLAPSLLFKGIFPMLKSQGGELPALTKVVMAIAEALGQAPVVLLSLFALFCLSQWIRSMLRDPKVACALMGFLKTQPGVGRMLQTVATARFSSALALQLDCGVGVTDALQLAANSSNNALLQRDITHAKEALVAGQPFDICLQTVDFFPQAFLSVLKAGQESGHLSTLLRHLAGMYDLEVDGTIDTLVSLIEPMVMLVMGLIVAVVVVALMLPMVNLVTTL